MNNCWMYRLTATDFPTRRGPRTSTSIGGRRSATTSGKYVMPLSAAGRSAGSCWAQAVGSPPVATACHQGLRSRRSRRSWSSHPEPRYSKGGGLATQPCSNRGVGERSGCAGGRLDNSTDRAVLRAASGLVGAVAERHATCPLGRITMREPDAPRSVRSDVGAKSGQHRSRTRCGAVSSGP